MVTVYTTWPQRQVDDQTGHGQCRVAVSVTGYHLGQRASRPQTPLPSDRLTDGVGREGEARSLSSADQPSPARPSPAPRGTARLRDRDAERLVYLLPPAAGRQRQRKLTTMETYFTGADHVQFMQWKSLARIAIVLSKPFM